MRTIFILVVIYLTYRIIKELLRPEGPASGPSGDEVDIGGGEEMALDPVCGSYVPVSSALRVRKGSEVVHFCGEECRKKFMASLKT
jgi:YHS domain-containing protein